MINFTGTNINDITRMLKLTATAGEGRVTILSRNQGTGALSSSYLTAYQLGLIAERVNALTPLIAGADLSIIAYILQALLNLADLTGIATPEGRVAAGIEYLDVVGLIDNQPTYVVATVPHSIVGGIGIAPL